MESAFGVEHFAKSFAPKRPTVLRPLPGQKGPTLGGNNAGKTETAPLLGGTKKKSHSTYSKGPVNSGYYTRGTS